MVLVMLPLVASSLLCSLLVLEAMGLPLSMELFKLLERLSELEVLVLGSVVNPEKTVRMKAKTLTMTTIKTTALLMTLSMRRVTRRKDLKRTTRPSERRLQGYYPFS